MLGRMNSPSRLAPSDGLYVAPTQGDVDALSMLLLALLVEDAPKRLEAPSPEVADTPSDEWAPSPGALESPSNHLHLASPQTLHHLH